MIKHDFDRVSGAVDRNLNQVDTNNIKLTFDNDSDTNTDDTIHDHNIKTEDKDTETQDHIQNVRLLCQLVHRDKPD